MPLLVEPEGPCIKKRTTHEETITKISLQEVKRKHLGGTLWRESGGASSMESSEDPTEDGGAGDDAEEQVAGRRRNAMRADRRGTEEVIGGIARRAGMIGGMGDEGSVWLEDGFWVEAIVLEVDGRKASCKEK